LYIFSSEFTIILIHRPVYLDFEKEIA